MYDGIPPNIAGEADRTTRLIRGNVQLAGWSCDIGAHPIVEERLESFWPATCVILPAICRA
jgi:hypothetical protein